MAGPVRRNRCPTGRGVSTRVTALGRTQAVPDPGNRIDATAFTSCTESSELTLRRLHVLWIIVNGPHLGGSGVLWGGTSLTFSNRGLKSLPFSPAS